MAMSEPPVASWDQGNWRCAGRSPGELHVVLYGLQRLFVPVQADDADLRARDHVQHAVHQAEPGPENGNDGHHLAGNGFHFHGPGPAFDGPLFGLELLGGFIHEQPGDFLGQHTEFAGGGGFLPKDAQFVPHERMINYMNRHTHSPLNKRIPETLPKRMGPPKREATPSTGQINWKTLCRGRGFVKITLRTAALDTPRARPPRIWAKASGSLRRGVTKS